MNKMKRKRRPSDYWRIGEHESWFADMAAKGLHIEKMGLHFAHFIKDKPLKTRYRIDVSFNKNSIPEQKQMYAENGWDYVTSYGDFNVFSSPVERNSPELHTDPAEQSYTLKELDKRFARSAMLVVALVILMIGMISAVWFFNKTPIIALVDGSMVQQAILIIVELYVAYTSLQAAISIRILRKTLSEGGAIDHNAPWKRRQWITMIVGIIFIILAILGSILPFVQIFMMETKTLPLTNTNLPIVRLADIEQNPNLVRESSSHIQDNVDWANRYSYNWGLLAPVQYKSDENGIVPNKMWEDGSGKYSPGIHTRVYKLRFPSMAKDLISDLIKRYSLEHRGGDFVEAKHADFDILIVHEVDGFKEIFASKGKAVMYVRYYGNADLDLVIKNTAQKMVLILDGNGKEI